MKMLLSVQGWSQRDIFAVQHLISCTGPRASISSIPFYTDEEKLLGQMVCSADYIGQMSDPAYLEKLPVLFREFEESDNFRGIPPEDRLFKSVDELLRGTPFFWNRIVVPKLEHDCGGLIHYLSEPYPDGINPYVLEIEHHIDDLKESLEKASAKAS